MIKPNYEKQLEDIQKDLKGIRNLLCKQIKKQEQTGKSYFYFGTGMALIAIGLSASFAGAAVSRLDFIIAGSIIGLIGLAVAIRFSKEILRR